MKSHFKIDGSYTVSKFPSGEIHIDVEVVEEYHDVTITGSILSSDNLMELLQLVEVLKNVESVERIHLYMPYCAYSRQDRRCLPRESFSLKIFTDIINACEFTSVSTFDNHSDVSTALINKCINTDVHEVIKDLPLDKYDALVSPDAGANKKVFKCAQRLEVPMIRADKVRDLKSGRISETVVMATAEELKGKNILIVDDICANGMTFIKLAEAVKAVQPNCTIDLYVSHGFFHSGLEKLKAAGISKFITTDSVCKIVDIDLDVVTVDM